jgi:hypothetical protein
MCLGDRVEMAINLPRVLSSNGRFDELVAHLQQRLGPETEHPGGHGEGPGSAPGA